MTANDDNGADDREWPDPSPGLDLRFDRRELAVRLACSGGVFFLLVIFSRDFLAEAIPLLWPPTDPITQWSMLVMLHAFGYVVVPLFLGSIIATVLLERVLE
ncbi:hypothetical protein OB919_12155 [Halobacteria archaeon AArc-curdl1]|uniref:Uncharacterized protein n=1 Tax=Natronosalvus hydrolyticus TaxID=2979988 RepID=A0AAP2Z9A6_9EURY|nr:hypothetical protein [Halobacteria archaeon AArc-curdl1]